MPPADKSNQSKNETIYSETGRTANPNERLLAN